MKKVVSVFLCLMLICGGLAAFSGCGATKTEITFMGWTNSTESKAYKTAKKKFEQMHNVTVNYNTVAVGEYKTKLNSMLAADSLTGTCTADVFYVPYGMLWDKMISGHVENLQPFIDADKDIDLSDYWDIPGFYQYTLDGDTVGKGDIYAFPKDVGPWTMVYNKDFFAKYGITAPTTENPWDYEDLRAIGKDVKAKNLAEKNKRDNWIIGAIDVDTAVWSNDGSFLSEDRKTVTASSPEVIETLEYISTCISEGVILNSTEAAAQDAYTRWINGQLGVYYAGPWDLANYKTDIDFNWDYLPLVAGKNGTRATSVGYMGLAMSSRSKNKDLAYEFIKFLTSDIDCQRTLYTAGQIVPNLKSITKGEFLDYTKQTQENGEEWIRILESYGRPYERHLTPSDAWYTPFTNGVGQVFMGDISAADFCAKINVEMQKKLTQSYDDMEALKKQVGWKPKTN